MNIRGSVNGVAARGGTRKSGVERFDEAQRCLGALARLPPRPETIAVERVVGSVDAAKAASLRPDFLPRRLGAQSPRYREVEEAMYTGTPLPAIEVYGLDGAYYVLDGHHRVAAARALGQLYLDALVHEFLLPGAVPSRAMPHSGQRHERAAEPHMPVRFPIGRARSRALSFARMLRLMGRPRVPAMAAAEDDASTACVRCDASM
ncbi:MAG TPA: hypothetical protein VFE42_02445 [Chloroflexota bacterium]|nr:hypothetical protein [Chloroflexota bacterium]